MEHDLREAWKWWWGCVCVCVCQASSQTKERRPFSPSLSLSELPSDSEVLSERLKGQRSSNESVSLSLSPQCETALAAPADAAAPVKGEDEEKESLQTSEKSQRAFGTEQDEELEEKEAEDMSIFRLSLSYQGVSGGLEKGTVHIDWLLKLLLKREVCRTVPRRSFLPQTGAPLNIKN